MKIISKCFIVLFRYMNCIALKTVKYTFACKYEHVNIYGDKEKQCRISTDQSTVLLSILFP